MITDEAFTQVEADLHRVLEDLCRREPSEGCRVLYHQGTIVSSEEDNVFRSVDGKEEGFPQ